jgi:hypothetical protein
VSLGDANNPVLYIGEIPLTLSQIIQIGVSGTESSGTDTYEEAPNSSADAGEDM